MRIFKGSSDFRVLAWCSGSVMDCHATAWGSIPCGDGVFTEFHVLFARDSKWGCRLQMTSLSMGRKTPPTVKCIIHLHFFSTSFFSTLRVFFMLTVLILFIDRIFKSPFLNITNLGFLLFIKEFL